LDGWARIRIRENPYYPYPSVSHGALVFAAVVILGILIYLVVTALSAP
jgi:hypothetical protein